MIKDVPWQLEKRCYTIGLGFEHSADATGGALQSATEMWQDMNTLYETLLMVNEELFIRPTVPTPTIDNPNPHVVVLIDPIKSNVKRTLTAHYKKYLKNR